MGNLITFNQASMEADWYFPDAYFNSSSSRWLFKWPNEEFPIRVGIHHDDMNPVVKVKIRKWIESTLTETVIHEQIDKSYNRNEHDWNKSYRVSNYWHGFNFENAESATMFSLCFSEYIKPITEEHPQWINA
jgi:hypothetical protein